MKKHFVLIALLVASVAMAQDSPLQRWKALSKQPGVDKVEHDRRVELFLKSLTKSEYKELMREIGQSPSFGLNTSEDFITMGIILNFYLKGPAKSDTLEERLADVHDDSIPKLWRFGILRVSGFDKRFLKPTDFQTIMQLLDQMRSELKNELVTYESLQLGKAIIGTQIELLEKSNPHLKEMLQSRDIAKARSLVLKEPSNEGLQLAQMVLMAIEDEQVVARKLFDTTTNEFFKVTTAEILNHYKHGSVVVPEKDRGPEPRKRLGVDMTPTEPE